MSSKTVIYFFESIGIFMCLYFLLQFVILKKREYFFYAIYLLLLVAYYFSICSKTVIYFFESIGIFMCLYFLLQFVILKKREYFFYAIYLLLLVAYYFCATPEIFLSGGNPGIDTFLDIFKRPIQFLISVFYTLFIIHYLSLEKQSRPLYRIFRFLMILYVVSACSCLVLNIFKVQYNTFYYIGSIILFPVQLYMVTALFKYKVPYGKFVIW